MSARACPGCAGESTRFAFERDGFAHVRCRTCGTLFVSPLPSDEAVRATYLDPHYHAGVQQAEPRMRSEAKARARVLADRGVRTLLEIGCGAGYFLDAAADLGMDVEGVDAGPTAELAVARGRTVHRTWLDAFTPTRSYDAIAMWEVVEHLTDPHATLRTLHGWLAPGGVLALSTPSSSGVPARVLGSRFPMVCPPEHLELFSRRGLAILLARAGFRPLYWTSFSNLDADTLARNFQRYFLGSSGPARTVSAILGRLAELPTRALDRLRLGTSFEVYAEASR